MSQFKWTIEYTISLTYPAFMYLTFMVDRVRADEAIDGTFAGYVAGKYGDKIADKLFRRRGNFIIVKEEQCTQEDLDEARARLKKALKITEEQLKKNV